MSATAARKAPLLLLLLVACAASGVPACGGTTTSPEAPTVLEVGRPPAGMPTSSVRAPDDVAIAREDDVPADVAVHRAIREAMASLDSPDAALLRAGYDAIERREMPVARKAFFDLVSKYPQSPLVPYAYLAFGEAFFEEAANDPSKYDLAKQAYAKVIEYPPPANRAHTYALHRLGLLAAKTGLHAQALELQRKVVAALVANADAPGRSALLVSARHELVVAYANAGVPAKAKAFFQAVDPEHADELLLALERERAPKRP